MAELVTVKESDLVLNTDYWLDSSLDVSGIYVGKLPDDQNNIGICFKRTSGTDYTEGDNGFIGFYPEEESVYYERTNEK